MTTSLNKLFDLDRAADIEQHVETLDKANSTTVLFRLLESPLSSPGIEKEIRRIYNESEIVLDSWVRGAFGFYLFSRAAERFAQTGSEDELEAANRIAAEDSTKRFLYDVYEIPPDSTEGNIELYRVGTTSYILRLGKTRVLKIIKFHFLENRTIREATTEYADTYGDLGVHSATVYASGERWILMQFLPGDTLREHLQKYLNNLSDLERVEQVKTLLLRLSSALRSCAELGKFHRDLSLDNVILYDTGAGYDPRLIDFGFNYFLSENVGSLAELDRVESYVAPEILKDLDNASIVSDIYSLGLIFLTLLTDTEDESAGDLSTRLDQAWRRYPEFAGLIEEMIDREPRYRLYSVERDMEIYEEINCQIRSAFRIFERVHAGAKSSTERLFELGSIFLGGSGKAGEIWRRLSAVRDDKLLAPRVRRLLFWAICTEISYSIVVLLFFVMSADAVGYGGAAGYVRQVLSWLGIQLQYTPGELRNLAGYLVAGSHGFVATHYYLNIFSTLEVRKRAPVTELWMRLNAFIFLAPTLWILLLRPQDWPFFAAAGAFFVTANNYYAHRAASEARTVVVEQLGLPISGSRLDDSITRYSNWWSLMALYGTSLVVIGAAMKAGLARDEWVYALVVAFAINIIKMYFHNCTRDAPETRALLERLFVGWERATAR